MARCSANRYVTVATRLRPFEPAESVTAPLLAYGADLPAGFRYITQISQQLYGCSRETPCWAAVSGGQRR